MNSPTVFPFFYRGSNDRLYWGHLVPTQKGPVGFLTHEAILELHGGAGGVCLDATLLEGPYNSPHGGHFYLYQGVILPSQEEN